LRAKLPRETEQTTALESKKTTKRAESKTTGEIESKKTTKRLRAKLL
jgi:hypothetical protein